MFVNGFKVVVNSQEVIKVEKESNMMDEDSLVEVNNGLEVQKDSVKNSVSVVDKEDKIDLVLISQN